MSIIEELARGFLAFLVTFCIVYGAGSLYLEIKRRLQR